MKNIVLLSTCVFVFLGCFKKEDAPKDWLDWTKKAQSKFDEKISIPSTLQHLYITLGEGEFYLSHTVEDDSYRLVKVSSFDVDKKFVIDFEKENLLLDGKVVGDKSSPIKISDRLSLRMVFYKDETSSKARIFLHDQNIKNLDKKRQRTFFDYSSTYKQVTNYKKLEKPEIKKFGRSDGTTRDFNKVGELAFKDSHNSLSVYSDPEEESAKVMLMFKDKTSGSSSYGAGRYVIVDLPELPSKLNGGEEVLIDFNYAFNPPCAVSKGYHCPLAQDFLDIKVKAGEKYAL